MTTPLRQLVDHLRAQQLLRDDAVAQVEGVEITDVTTDSRGVRPGVLFCAIRGTAGDGHTFLRQAMEAGAAAALVEEIDAELPLVQIAVIDGRLAAAHAAAEHFGHPWQDVTMVGITGTNGKTTSAAIIRHLLSTAGPAASIGTLGAVDAAGAVVPGSEGLTTPGPVDVARWIRRLRDRDVAAVAMETSSHALHQNRIAAVRFDAVLFTNFSRDHLDYHVTERAYLEAKLRLASLVKPTGATVINADDPAWRQVTLAEGTRKITFGIDTASADVRAESLCFGPGGVEFTLQLPDDRIEVKLPLFGTYNVTNALGAAAVLWALGSTAAEIAGGLGTLPQVPGRLERVPLPAGFPMVLIDYAHTPDALARALEALRPLVRGELVVVFGAGGDRDRGKRPEMGRVAAAGADRVIVTSDNPRTEDPEAIADDIEAGMGSAPHQRIIDRREAIRYALTSAGPTDVVLLAGKGHETYQIRGTEKLPFDERVIIREILAEIGAEP